MVATEILGGGSTVEAERWQDACICPGSDTERERLRLAKIEGEKRKLQMSAAAQEADLSPGDSPKAIQAKLTRAFQNNGLPAHTGFPRLSRFLAAGLGKPGTRTIRLIIESGRGLRAARRRGSAARAGSEHAEQLHRMRHSLAIIWSATGAAFTAARMLKGPSRLGFAALGGFLSAVGVAFAALTYAASSLGRAADPTTPTSRRPAGPADNPPQVT